MEWKCEAGGGDVLVVEDYVCERGEEEEGEAGEDEERGAQVDA